MVALAVLGAQLDSMVLGGFSNLKPSVIPSKIPSPTRLWSRQSPAPPTRVRKSRCSPGSSSAGSRLLPCSVQTLPGAFPWNAVPTEHFHLKQAGKLHQEPRSEGRRSLGSIMSVICSTLVIISNKNINTGRALCGEIFFSFFFSSFPFFFS